MTNGKRTARESDRQEKKLMKAIRASGVGRLKYISLSEGMALSLSDIGNSFDFIWIQSTKGNPKPKPAAKDFAERADFLAAKKAWQKTDTWIARQELKKAIPKLHQAGIRFCDEGGRYLQAFHCHNKRLVK